LASQVALGAGLSACTRNPAFVLPPQAYVDYVASS
jgi:hypothetical protein